MDLVSAQYSDSEGEMSDDERLRRNDEDEDRFHAATATLPFRMTLEPPGGVSGGSSGHNTPPPPPRGGRALSGSPDIITASLLGSRQPSPKSGTDSPLLRAPPAGRGGLGGGQTKPKSHGLSGLVTYHGDDDEEDEEEKDANETVRRKSVEDEREDASHGLVPDYWDMSMANVSVLDRTLTSRTTSTTAASIPTDGPLLIPPEPPGRCSKALQEKIAQQYERYLRDGIDYNKYIQRKKEFKNPSIYEKLIEYSGIYEFGTNYPPDVYDPYVWGPESSYEELAKAQKSEMDKREEKRKGGGDGARAKVEFVSGTAKKNASASSTNVVVSEGEGKEKEKKRKSKWDQGTSDGSAPPPPVGVASSTSLPDVSAPAVTSASVLAQATGTKTTVISAVGGLLKKPKS